MYPELQIIQDYEEENNEVGLCLEFIDMNSEDDSSFYFVKGTQKGSIYLYQVEVISDDKVKVKSTKHIYQFPDAASVN